MKGIKRALSIFMMVCLIVPAWPALTANAEEIQSGTDVTSEETAADEESGMSGAENESEITDVENESETTDEESESETTDVENESETTDVENQVESDLTTEETENGLAAAAAFKTLSAAASQTAVTVYADNDGAGTSQEFGVGSYNWGELSNGVGNDSMSSIVVPAGYVVTLYADKDYSGYRRVVTQSCNNLGDLELHDAVSSLIVSLMPSNPVVTAYNDGDYWGTSQSFLPGEYDWESLNQGVGNDKISSLRIQPGYRVTLFNDYGFRGDSRVLTQDISNLKSVGFNDAATSLLVEPFPLEPVVTLYGDIDYLGKSQQLTPGEYDVDALEQGIGNDALSSIRITQGYQVTLYHNHQFGGGSRVLTHDSAYIDQGFHDAVSSIRVEAVNPLDGTCVDITNMDDQRKAEVVRTFAPRIWMPQGAQYMPSSVEHALANTNRTWMDSTNSYWYVAKEPLQNSESRLPYFYGDLANAKIYSFWVEKDFNNIDISYFQFSPYDKGKDVILNEFGNHVGDWEHVTVRLAHFTWEGREYLKPIQVVLPSHGFRSIYAWSDMEKTDGTHVVAYSADGSHGMWKDAGSHVYHDLLQLTDVCNQGTAWDTWNSLRIFQYDARTHTGRGVNGETWPTYFNNDYSNPDSQSAERWGNPAMGSLFGQALLADGPGGPESKDVLRDYVKLD